ncbi:hypothetical protein LH452_14490 [Laribacter hongkongensis]|uniref:hypothetical protein n=1 Tax=Laribacter hongkongensis TaxID=168471 RepID=UPI001EFE511F|nr:hypothetical protein [Laribacter hongkongensis]MCG9060103.1 hypothetical protein [Laribacter hongkongensis]MCG9087176.1 hypothetical protein [Laribacter hongkongensis]
MQLIHGESYPGGTECIGAFPFVAAGMWHAGSTSSAWQERFDQAIDGEGGGAKVQEGQPLDRTFPHAQKKSPIQQKIKCRTRQKWLKPLSGAGSRLI